MYIMSPVTVDRHLSTMQKQNKKRHRTTETEQKEAQNERKWKILLIDAWGEQWTDENVLVNVACSDSYRNNLFSFMFGLAIFGCIILSRHKMQLYRQKQKKC